MYVRLNGVFLPQEEIMCECCICAKIVDRDCIEMERCGSATQSVDKMKFNVILKVIIMFVELYRWT